MIIRGQKKYQAYIKETEIKVDETYDSLDLLRIPKDTKAKIDKIRIKISGKLLVIQKKLETGGMITEEFWAQYTGEIERLYQEMLTKVQSANKSYSVPGKSR